MKIIPTILCLFITNIVIAQSEYVVQVAAFEKQVTNNYFSTSNETIAFYKDYQSIYHYYIGSKFNSKQEAEVLANKMRGNYPNAIVLDLSSLKECNNCCGAGSVYEGAVENTPTYEPSKKVQTYSIMTPPPTTKGNCEVSKFTLKNQQDFEKIRTVIASTNAEIFIRKGTKSQELKCYLSMRNAQLCGLDDYTNAEIKNMVSCTDSNSDVYLVDHAGKVLDIENEFKRIAAITSTSNTWSSN